MNVEVSSKTTRLPSQTSGDFVSHQESRTSQKGRLFQMRRNSPLIGKPFVCEVCSKGFSQEATLDMHRLAHNSSQLSCKFCEREFSSLGCLQKHCLLQHADEDDSNEHSNEKVSPVRKCETLEDDSGSHIDDDLLLDNASKISTTKKPFVCKVCNRQLTSRRNLSNHLKTHAKKFRCHHSKTSDCILSHEKKSKGNILACGPLKEKSEGPAVNNHCLNIKSEINPFSHDCAEGNSEGRVFCKFCKQEFPSQGCLQKHCLKQHADEPSGESDECQGKTKLESQRDKSIKEKTDIADLRARCLMYVEQKPFICKECGMMFVTQKNFEMHMMAHDDMTPAHKRPLYMRKRKNKDELDSIQKPCTDDESCIDGDIQDIEQVEHSSGCLKEERLQGIKSQTCEDVSSNENPLPNSTRKKSAKKKSFVCQVCEKQLTTRRSLNNHLQMHAKTFRCHHSKTTDCISLFHENREKAKGSSLPCDPSSKESKGRVLASHLVNAMSQSNDSACDPSIPKSKVRIVIISKANQKSEVDDPPCEPVKEESEARASTYSRSTRKSNRQSKKTPEEEFNCNICGKSYRLKIAFMSHMMSHTAPKHQCEVCQKEFVSNKLLKLHFRSHSDVRIFFCELCNKGFKHKHNLRTHFITHTDERPYICEECGRGFKHKWGLKGHEKMHAKGMAFAFGVRQDDLQENEDLQGHLLIHETEQNLKIERGTECGQSLKCERCGLVFERPHELTEHVATHEAGYGGTETSAVCSRKVHPFEEGSDGISPLKETSRAIKMEMPLEESSWEMKGRMLLKGSDSKTVSELPLGDTRGELNRGIMTNVHSIGESKTKLSNETNQDLNVAMYLKVRLKTEVHSDEELTTEVPVGESSHKLSAEGPFNNSNTPSEKSEMCCNDSSSKIQMEPSPKILTENVFEEPGQELMSIKTVEGTTRGVPIGTPFVCEICKKGFRLKSYLKRHSDLHMKGRIFSCEWCNKRFRNERLLRNHRLSHTTEKKYECDVCGKGFNLKSKLKIHSVVHVNEVIDLY